MSPSRRIVAPELLRPRLEVLKAGLSRLKNEEEEGAGTIRRMGKVFLNWAIGEELGEVERAASAVVAAEDSDLLESGLALRILLEDVFATLGPASTERFFVLAVEDNVDDGLLLSLGLKSEDRTVEFAFKLAEAQRILEQEEVDLLVMDLHLPDGDGRTLLSDLRDQTKYRDLTVLVVSGKDDPGVEAECLALGATSFFRKPIDPTALAAAASLALHLVTQRRIGAQTDFLTGLLNRRAVRGLWDRWKFPDPSSIGLLGMDAFEALEDRLDHETADAVLASVGRVLRDMVPRGCVSARWEDSRFLIFFPGFDPESATQLLEKIVRGIRGLEHEDARGETFRVTASGGVVELFRESDFDDAVKEGQGVLEAAMKSGGNTVGEGASSGEAVTVLVAEDDPLSAGILVHRLEREGFRVLHFTDGAQALEGALSDQIDCAILDVKMPGMDGFELLERLRKIPVYHGLPIVMLTSMGREEDIARGFELGADDYMVKPFSPVEVLARIRRLLKR